MTEELEQLLKNLKLRRLLNVYHEQLQAAKKAQTSYTEFEAGLLRAQWHERPAARGSASRHVPPSKTPPASALLRSQQPVPERV
jgi:hypothetical protein